MNNASQSSHPSHHPASNAADTHSPQFNISKVLVALEQDHIAGNPADNTLIDRAVQIARAFSSALHLCVVVHRPAAPLLLAASTDSSGMLLEEVSNDLRNLITQVEAATDIDNIKGSVVMDKPRAQGFIDKALEVDADLILKQSKDARFLLGLLSNTDWDLLRDAPLPVWLTSGDSNPKNGVMAAIECRLEQGDDERLFLDRRVFAASKELSDRFTAPLHLIHTYQVHGMQPYHPIYPEGGVSPSTVNQLRYDLDKERDRIGRIHGAAIQTFVDETGVPLDDILVMEGDTAAAIKLEAEKHEVGLVVMGADEGAGRWDRLMQNVHAEPTLDHAPCDILFIH